MKELEKRTQEVVFDVETQYCDPSDCYHDCYHEGVNNCDADMSTIWFQRKIHTKMLRKSI